MKTVMFMYGFLGPFVATWDTRKEGCPRITVDESDGTGLVLPDDATSRPGARFTADRYDRLGNHLGTAKCQAV